MNGIGVSAVAAYSAHREWASRPPDERYASVHALHEAARARRLRTEERTIETVTIRTDAVAPDALALRDTSGRQADEAYSLADAHETNPRSLGLRARTHARLSQRTPWQDGRFTLDRAASRLLTTVH